MIIANDLLQSIFGVDIQILKKGHSTAPRIGQKVSVHYTLALENGNKIDSSTWEPGIPLEFTVGMGEVISGLDEGIQKVLLGSRVRMTISPVSSILNNPFTKNLKRNIRILYQVRIRNSKMVLSRIKLMGIIHLVILSQKALLLFMISSF